VAFLTLTLVTLFVRWPKRPGWLVMLPAAYALLSEGLQHFFPPRSVQLVDLGENLLGIVLGTGLYWVVVALFAPKPPRDRWASLKDLVVAGSTWDRQLPAADAGSRAKPPASRARK
jgi:uncharacterized membrane protein YccC